MKKVILLIAVLLLLTGGSYACPCIGLYIDSMHSICEWYGFGGFTVWVWHHPNESGMLGAEFKIAWSTIDPEFGLAGYDTYPDMVFTGDPLSGVQVTFASCTYDWIWSYKLEFFSPFATTSYIQVLPYPPSDQVRYQSCVTQEMYEVLVYNLFGFNTSCVVGTEETSWGAIKSLYK